MELGLASASPVPAAPLEQRIENQIVQRTWGRIHRLQVELADDRIVVHGQTSSYYAKQLALEGVLDVIGSTAPTSVDLDIQVGADTHGRMLYAPVRAERAI